MEQRDPAAAVAFAAARAGTQAAMQRTAALGELAERAGPTAAAALAAWLSVTVGAAQRGETATAEQRIAAAVQLREARDLLHRLGDELLTGAAALDRAAVLHVEAVQAAPTRGTA